MAQPVFYDPRRARWRRIRTLLDVTGILLSAVIVVFIYTTIRGEPLPKLLLQFQKRPYHALKENEAENFLAIAKIPEIGERRGNSRRLPQRPLRTTIDRGTPRASADRLE